MIGQASLSADEILIGNIDIQLAALRVFLDNIADSGFKQIQSSRKLDTEIQITVIHRLHLHQHLMPVIRNLCPAKTGHALYHDSSLPAAGHALISRRNCLHCSCRHPEEKADTKHSKRKVYLPDSRAA